MSDGRYPVMERHSESHEHQVFVRGFMRWISATYGISLGAWQDTGDGDKKFVPFVAKSVDALLDDYLGIDQRELERERRAYIAELAASNGEGE